MWGTRKTGEQLVLPALTKISLANTKWNDETRGNSVKTEPEVDPVSGYNKAAQRKKANEWKTPVPVESGSEFDSEAVSRIFQRTASLLMDAKKWKQMMENDTETQF